MNLTEAGKKTGDAMGRAFGGKMQQQFQSYANSNVSRELDKAAGG
jgi:hypothetical protein